MGHTHFNSCPFPLQNTLYAEPAASDDDHYWVPGHQEEEIYQQISVHRYHEFDGNCIEIMTKLGKGQFGEVYKAVLKSPTGTSQDVAVKVAKKGAPQEERVKLLQEAAIMGQFKHKHVVDLKGIVRDKQVRTQSIGKDVRQAEMF